MSKTKQPTTLQEKKTIKNLDEFFLEWLTELEEEADERLATHQE